MLTLIIAAQPLAVIGDESVAPAFNAKAEI
jgi:hypothetical protein